MTVRKGEPYTGVFSTEVHYDLIGPTNTYSGDVHSSSLPLHTSFEPLLVHLKRSASFGGGVGGGHLPPSPLARVSPP